MLNIFILYDSITNSVFESQVLSPLIKSGKRWHIISFEKDLVTPPTHPNITFIIFEKKRFWCTWSLRTGINNVRTYLTQYATYHITSRGPFAGYIALHATTNNCKQITIQARGLAAQEYAYAHRHSHNPLHYIRKWLLHYLEQKVYATKKQHVFFQAVSPALKNYLIKTFHANKQRISIACQDIPEIIPKQEHIHYRTAIRKQLHINTNRMVYCYSGSYKPWQCPQETITFFKQQYAQNNNCFLLILTPDVQAFTHHAQRILSRGTYHVCNLQQQELYHYLAAADFGILLREPHIINYISRPTKALEYHAAGLYIIHNDTVDYIKHINGVKQQVITL